MKRFRMFWTIIPLVAAIAAAFSLCGCTERSDHQSTPSGSAMYYWKTVFRLDPTEQTFLQRHSVNTLYVRFFDVVNGTGGAEPNATITFDDSIPHGVECVPVVFILNDCMRKPRPDLPKLIADRVFQMCETNDIPAPKEIQIDCDWTATTRSAFFGFMEELRQELKERNAVLSATIRLHQLSQKAPPADYGVLMVYNTGDYRVSGRNPIFDPQDIEPYLRYVNNYDLPLIATYPIFSWKILYGPESHGSKNMVAKGFVYDINPDSLPSLFRRKGDDRWMVVGTRNIQSAAGDMENMIRATPGMELVLYSPPPLRTLHSLQNVIRRKRPGIDSRVVLFDLDSQDLNNYTPQQYDSIFHP